MHVAGKAAYTLTPQTTLSAAVGIFNTAEDTAGMSRESALAGTTYAGGSNLATEIDAWLDYQLYSNTTVSLFVAYAVMGDALDLVMDGVVYESQDAMGAGARIIYTF